MVKLFVSGFPLNIDELELAKLIGPYGDICTVKLVRDKKTRVCKGYGFVEMAAREGAEQAEIALDGLEVGGRQLTVKIREEEIAAGAPLYRKVERRPNLAKNKRPRSGT